MRHQAGLTLIALAVGVTGCDQKQQDQALAQGKAAVSTAADFAGRTWKSASAQAAKINLDSARPAIESAKSGLESAKEKLSGIKMPSNMDSLKLDSIESQLHRLEAALSVKQLQKDLDEKVAEATKYKDNTTKSVQDVKKKLEEADSQYRDLQNKLKAAEAEYDAASAKVKETAQKLESL